MVKTAIISAASDPYFGLLADLLDSIDRHKPAAASPDICILDVGLTAAQRDSLKPRVTRIHAPGWDFDFPNRAGTPVWFQTMTARPFFPRHFPEYDRYIFLDADAWLQDWRAVDLLTQASDPGTLAIVPEIHAGYADAFRQRPGITDNIRKHYLALADTPTADHMATLPVINAGVFAMRRESPIWQTWADALRAAYARDNSFMTDQCALNAAIYTGKIPFHPLPAWCNWICSQRIPVFNPQTHTFHEPTLPHERISILHLADIKQTPVPVRTLTGNRLTMPLTHAAANGI